MRAGTINITEATVAAYLGWWNLAGVDCAFHDELPAARAATVQVPVLAQAPVQAVPAPPAAAKFAAVDPVAWPEALDALQAALGAASGLPGTDLSRIVVAPTGAVGAPVMIIGDCPSAEDCKAGSLFAGSDGALIANILRALGLDAASAYRATLASSRPASGVLDVTDVAACGALMRHHIALARPERVILFGAAATRALLDCDLRDARGRLHFLNHDHPSMAAVATHHPRTMLGHPGCKREAWADLKLLLGEMTS